MNVPNDSMTDRAELFIQLPADWDCQNMEDDKWKWPFECLMRLAQYPFNNESYLGGPVSFVSFGDPAEKFVPGCDYTSLMLTRHEVLPKFDGDQVTLYRVTPVFESERRYEEENGPAALMKLLEEKRVPRWVTLDRKPAV